MSRLINTLSRAMDGGHTRRSFLKRFALGATALSVAPVDYLLHPVTAYAQICGCADQDCECGSLCCDGYTEFCCTFNGINACPTGTFSGGWWQADGSEYCAGPRYYIDCMAECTNCSTGCSSGPFCDPACDNTLCQCALGSCANWGEGCVTFRYGQCNQEIACSGRISCRVATCTPPWVLDSTCTTTSATDDTTADQNRPCLQTATLANVNAVRMDGADAHSEVHVINGGDNYQDFLLEVISILGTSNPTEWAFTNGGANGNGLLDVMAVRMDGADGHTEVHVLNGRDNYQSFKIEVISILGTSNPMEWAFAHGGPNGNGLTDVNAIRMDGADGHTEVHVLNAENNYQSFKIEVISILGTTNPTEWKFTSGAVNGNGLADVIAVRMDGAQGHTEVHVLNGEDNYQSFKIEVISVLGTTNANEWAFTSGGTNPNGLVDVIALRLDGAQGHTEVHVLDGGTNYQSFKLEAISILGTTNPTEWAFPT